jgi:N-acetylglucosaminyldiphosphoundecaprenol N-acetyl-beta-D-mannosaminyltransferase
MIPQPPLAATPPRPRRSVLGVAVDDVTLAEAVDLVDRYLAAGTPHQIVTPNPEMVMRARRDPHFRAVLNAADLAIPDGVGLLWATRCQGRGLRAVVPGSALVHPMAARSAARGERWFLLGAAPGIAAAAGHRLAATYPGLTIAGSASLSPQPADDEAARAAIQAAAPVDVLLVAYGAPGQELWMHRNQPSLGIPVAMGVGGTFNFLAGISPVPPAWAGRLGLIWLYRLLTEPWRWRRQRALLPFAVLALAEALSIRLRGER